MAGHDESLATDDSTAAESAKRKSEQYGSPNMNTSGLPTPPSIDYRAALLLP
jgi:hypothetical protein